MKIMNTVTRVARVADETKPSQAITRDEFA